VILGVKMRKYTWIIIAFAAAIFFNGCIQIETKLFVKKDGSGIISERVVMSKTFVNMLKEFAQSFQDTTSADEFVLFNDEEIIDDAKSYGPDVSYVSHEFINDDKWEGYTAVYSFNDVSKVKLTPDPEDKVEVGMAEEKNGQAKDYYYFSFVKGDVAELIIDRPEFKTDKSGWEESEQDETQEVDDQLGDEFLGVMEGMSIKVKVGIEGNIVNTNASYVDGSEITLFQMDLSEMMKNKDNFKEFTNKQPKNVDEMQEFLEKFPSLKLEIEKPVKIEFN
jgi:hypothetical protein